MNLPVGLPEKLRQEYTFEPVRKGESGAGVFYLTAPGKPPLYLKTAPAALGLQLEQEAQVLAWLRGKLPVPDLLAFDQTGGQEYLLMSALAGADLEELAGDQNTAALVQVYATGLKQLHSVPVAGCPVRRTLTEEIAAIEDRVRQGMVDETDFDPVWQGRSAASLLEELIRKRPAEEDLVFTHGDYCLPNVMAGNGYRLSGFIDLNRAGLGDRYRDLALAFRSIEEEFGREWLPPFMAAYGLGQANSGKIAFYQLVDEFF